MGKLIVRMPDSGTIQRRILDHFRSIGQRGSTVDEVASSLGLLHQQASPAVSSLRLAGYLEHKGKATRCSDCNRQIPVLVLSLSFSIELAEAGYAVALCQCGTVNKFCSQHTESECQIKAGIILELTSGETRFMCLECAVATPQHLVRASRSIGDKKDE